YDPNRQRIVTYVSGGGLLAIDANGATSPLPAQLGGPGPLAPTGDGRIFVAHNSDPIAYLTLGNAWVTLHDVNGTSPPSLPDNGFAVHSAIFDVGTNSLIVARDGPSGTSQFVRLHLSIDGTRIVEPPIVVNQPLIDSGAAVGGISSAPSGQIMLSLD